MGNNLFLRNCCLAPNSEWKPGAIVGMNKVDTSADSDYNGSGGRVKFKGLVKEQINLNNLQHAINDKLGEVKHDQHHHSTTNENISKFKDLTKEQINLNNFQSAINETKNKVPATPAEDESKGLLSKLRGYIYSTS